MIIDKVSNMYKYFGALNDLETVYKVLTENNLAETPDGQFKTDSPRVRYNICSYETNGDTAPKAEIHIKEIDVQVILKGQEKMGISPYVNAPEIQPYSDETDAAFIESKPLVTSLTDNTMFALFFPGEPHACCMIYGEKCKIKKALFKIKY